MSMSMLFTLLVVMILSEVSALMPISSLVAKKVTYNYMKLHAELRILIHGTKNAFTTLRENDIVLYKMDKAFNDQWRALGVFKSDMTILPLCNDYVGSVNFFVDEAQDPLRAERLKEEGKLLRIVSSDRRGDKFIIEEYIDSDVYIPLQIPAVSKGVLATSTTQSTIDGKEESLPVGGSGDSKNIDEEIIKAEIELAELKLRLLQVQKQQLVAKGDSGGLVATALTTEPIHTDKAPNAVGPYSQAVRISNGFVFVSGCVGLNPDELQGPTNSIVPGGVVEETKQSLQNLKAILDASGSSLQGLCKTVFLLKNINDYREVNRVYMEFLRQNGVTGEFPARSAFAVAALPLGALIEIEGTAVVL